MMIDLPTNCPICGSKLEWKGVDLICTNKECDNIKEQDLIAWTGVLGSIDGLAWLTKKKYFESLSIKSIEDLHNYIDNTLIIERKNYISITDKKMLDMFDKIRTTRFLLEEALQALNIERLGSESSKKIANNEEAYNLIMIIIAGETAGFGVDYNFDSIKKLVGPATTRSIVENKEKFARLNKINIEKFKKIEEKEIVATFCVTGKLERMKRNDLIKLAEEKGWKSLGGVTKECDYLVTNDTTSGSSKNKKAKELGTEIITEQEFYQKLGI